MLIISVIVHNFYIRFIFVNFSIVPLSHISRLAAERLDDPEQEDLGELLWLLLVKLVLFSVLFLFRLSMKLITGFLLANALSCSLNLDLWILQL